MTGESCFHCLFSRCHGDDIHLHVRHVCDNIVHCLHTQDDESMCDSVSYIIVYCYIENKCYLDNFKTKYVCITLNMHFVLNSSF